MRTDAYELPPDLTRVKTRSKTAYRDWRYNHLLENGFRCQHCGAFVITLPEIAGVNNRNHCPFCLWSRHVDYQHPGDRMSACKAVMKPIALAMKPSRNKYACCDRGELMLVHRCGDCSKLSINRIAADDQPMMIEQIFRTSLTLDVITRDDLDHAQIHTLRADDEAMLYSQLYGFYNQR